MTQYAKTKNRVVDNHIPNTYQAHKAWNKYHPNDPIISGEGFVIHHIDLNNQNNSEGNLQKMTREDHTILHNKTRIMSDTTKAAISKANKGNKIWLGRKHSESSKKKMSESQSGENHRLFGKTQSEETKKKMSDSAKKRWKNQPKRIVSEETKLKMSIAQTKRHQQRRALCQ